MTDAKGVLLLTAASGWRGSATSYLKIARALREASGRVLLHAGGEGFAAPFRADGFAVRVHAYPDSGWANAFHLARHLREHRIGVVIADTPRDLRLAVLARIRSSHRVLYRYNLSYRAPATDLASRTYIRGARGLIFQSRAVAHAFDAAYPSLGGLRRWIVPNGYGEEAFVRDVGARETMRARLDLDPTRAVIATGAMLVRTKGHDVVFRAVRSLLDAGRAVTLVVAGGGGHADAIRADAEGLGLDVRFTGMLSPGEMRAVYAAADLVVHGAEHEIFPNAIAEAMAQGRAVIGVDSWGTPEVLGDAGVIVPPRDPVAMAAAIAALLDDPARREALGAAAEARLRREYPLARMAKGYAEIVRSEIGGVTRGEIPR
ncbi:MAG TPA: glycosyltransferase family 4 protein [Gemmatimonadales bacterium]|nr:glycosyltransferase family 4 protein [Gemmatimonadales bacterium]